ncbi:unnamed protein product [Soboliphyme baturini]|uniref:GrpE protein homolog n=1 Tax=Soboliphyme baturini TaxID=241478 RepID=A0A183IW51_9BILA|nr:unnamed protein product [Soboliphyme baturini]
MTREMPEASEDPKKVTAQLEELKKLNVELNGKLADLEDKYLRSLAETENLRRRMLRQVEEAKAFGIQNFCKDMLEIADILQIAVNAIPESTLNSSQEVKNLHEGMVMTKTQLLKIFAKHGLVQENPLGMKFDPNIHEAVFEIPDPKKEPGTVAVVQKVGYLLHNRTLRAAQVGVVKAAS